MEDTELPLEKIHEDIEHASHGESRGSWLTWAALTSAILAVLGSIGALSSGHHANEAMLDQLRASDNWAHYQSKSLKASMLETRRQILAAMGKDADVKDKLGEYALEQEGLKRAAEESEHASRHHFHSHETFAQSVTLFQIAIAVTAIAVLAGRRRFLIVACGFGAVGCVFLIQGFAFV